jgi:hypothetical protein
MNYEQHGNNGYNGYNGYNGWYSSSLREEQIMSKQKTKDSFCKFITTEDTRKTNYENQQQQPQQRYQTQQQPRHQTQRYQSQQQRQQQQQQQQNFALTTTKRYTYENHRDYANVARRYEAPRYTPYNHTSMMYGNRRAHNPAYGERTIRSETTPRTETTSRGDMNHHMHHTNYTNHVNHTNYQNHTNHIDHLANLLPGPLVPSPYQDLIHVENTAIYSRFAKNFFEDELKKLHGDIHVMYESVRRFGRFDMKEGNIILDPNEKDDEHISGLSRLWQLGNGYIYVKIVLPKEQNSYRQRNVVITIYQVKRDSYERLENKETEKMVMEDPLWDNIKRNYNLQYV